MTNREKYITSGLLELYLAGQLSPQETAEVDAAIRQHPEVRAELEALEASLLQYHAAHAQSPPSNKLPGILGELDRIEETERVGREEAERMKLNGAKPRTRRSTPFMGMRIAAVLAIGLLLGSAALNYYLWQRLRQASNQIDSIERGGRQRFQNLVVLRDSVNTLRSSVAFYEDPNSQPVYLASPDGKGDNRVLVFWNPTQEIVKLRAVRLPAPPAGKQYQLWALADGKPIDAGVFDYADASAGLETMKPIGAAQAFAITLEDMGGKPSPTLEAMVALGNVGS